MTDKEMTDAELVEAVARFMSDAIEKELDRLWRNDEYRETWHKTSFPTKRESYLECAAVYVCPLA